jgi:hypothetical protein
MNEQPDTPEPVKSEWALTPEEAARVEAGHREMKIAEASDQRPANKPVKMSAQFVEEKHPRDETGKFADKGASKPIHKSLVVDKAEQSKFLENGYASAFRIHDGEYALPKASRNVWTDGEESMNGVSGYSSLNAAIADMLFGESESVTGENYTSQVKNPVLTVLNGRAFDGPGAEMIVKTPKIAAIITKQDLEASFRDYMRSENDDEMTEYANTKTMEEILEDYDFSQEMPKIEAKILQDLRERSK